MISPSSRVLAKSKSKGALLATTFAPPRSWRKEAEAAILGAAWKSGLVKGWSIIVECVDLIISRRDNYIEVVPQASS
jgi:hypothetical protein